MVVVGWEVVKSEGVVIVECEVVVVGLVDMEEDSVI